LQITVKKLIKKFYVDKTYFRQAKHPTCGVLVIICGTIFLRLRYLTFLIRIFSNKNPEIQLEEVAGPSGKIINERIPQPSFTEEDKAGLSFEINATCNCKCIGLRCSGSDFVSLENTIDIRSAYKT